MPTFGCQLTVDLQGDLVFEQGVSRVGESKQKQIAAPATSVSSREDQSKTNLRGGKEAVPRNNRKRKKVDRSLPRVKVLSSADIASGVWSIFDVVLPTPGCDVVYPPHLKPYYDSLLAEKGLMCINNKTHKMKDAILTGSYRKWRAKVKDVSWNISTYQDAKQTINVREIPRHTHTHTYKHT